MTQQAQAALAARGWGAPGTPRACRVALCGAGELGKEVAIALQRLGCEVIALDRYADAPAMQVAHRSHVLPMTDEAQLLAVLRSEKPDLIVPEIEAIATSALVTLEGEGFTVVPTARAAQLTMNREGIRRLAAETLALPTSPYRFADSEEGFQEALAAVGYPCVVKPVMSSSGKGQSTLKGPEDAAAAWRYAREGSRGSGQSVIVEGFIDFDYEITLLTVRHRDGTLFCDPIGHVQVDGDYRESWQPQPMAPAALEKAKAYAAAVTEALGGFGLFGVEFFIKGDEVWFSEVSPRPHDTGLVTLLSQSLSEFELHARAILGLPIPGLESRGPAASAVLLLEGEGMAPRLGNLAQALAVPTSDLRLFGKPDLAGRRRLGVALALGAAVDEARARARSVIAAIQPEA
ncbi:MAG: formate-dependent phosphoribosylglycinamide formyltransferase [Pseudomonadales bacterium]|nr:formate-dependent phosphoribosylglycinamide formyltransferase [Pseudomonadales bacterium]